MSLEIHADVSKVLGRDAVDRLQRDGVTALCIKCRVELSSKRGDQVAVSVVRYLDADEVFFTHASCAWSQVIAVGRISDPIGSDDVTYWGVALPSHPSPRALLLFHWHHDALFTQSGERIDAGASALLGEGFTMLTAVGKVPPSLDDWWVEIDSDTDDGRIVSPDGKVFLDSLPSSPTWRSIAISSAWVTVIAGRLLDVDQDGEVDLPLLGRLAKRGELVAGRIRVRKTSSGVHPIVAAGRQVAGYLQQASERAARRPGERVDPSFLLQFRSEPRLLPAMVENVPPQSGVSSLLYIDLQEPDLEYARSLISRLVNHGFRTGPGPSRDHLLGNAPRGWAVSVWASQVMVFYPERNNHRGIALFERLAVSSQEWLKWAKERQAVGVVIGNQMGDDPVSDLEVMIRSGEAIGMGMPAMGMG